MKRKKTATVIKNRKAEIPVGLTVADPGTAPSAC